MATVLRVLQVRLKTTGGWQDHVYDLDAPVVAVIGPVDTGKSSLLDCIAFVLGRDIPVFRGVVDQHLKGVQVEIRVATGRFKLTRMRNTARTVLVEDAVGDTVGRFPLHFQEGKQTLSDWLLEQLGLADAFAAVYPAAGKRLEFETGLLPFCYITQTDIDQHITMPPSQDAIRRVVLRLLLQLTTPAYERESSQIRDLDNEIRRLQRSSTTVTTFLNESVALAPAMVTAQLAELRIQEEAALKHLAKLKTDARDVLGQQDWIEERTVRDAVGKAEEQLMVSERKHREAERELEQIVRSLEALETLEADEPAMPPLALHEHPHCPACRQETTTPPAGHCYLCGRLLPGGAHAAERVRLQRLRLEVLEAIGTCATDVVRDRAEAAKAQQLLVKLLQRQDDRTRNKVAPYVDEIEQGARRLSAIQQQLADLGAVQRDLRRVDDQHTKIAALEQERDERRARLTLEGVGIHRPVDVPDDLSSSFRAIVNNIDLPNFTGNASIDPTSLLPFVDGQSFDARGGGARAAVSVAYNLTLLSHALEDDLSLLPGLLMIDSPQKNFGANQQDQALARRVYESFLDARRERGEIGERRFERPFQLIIVDNDMPKPRKGIKIIEFKRGDGLIKDVPELVSREDDAQQLTLDEMAE